MKNSLRLAGCLLAALLASCTARLPVPQACRPEQVQLTLARAPKEPKVRIFILADNLHTGIVTDIHWLEESGYRRPAGVKGDKWAAFSWGDEVAYRQKRWLNPWQVFHALCIPSSAVMEIIPFDWKVEKVCLHQRIYEGEVPRSAGPILAQFLNSCGEQGPDGRPMTVDKSSWGEGMLIKSPSNYTYYFPRICNVWTSQALVSCGFDFKTIKSLSADGIIRQAVLPKNGFKKIWGGS